MAALRLMLASLLVLAVAGCERLNAWREGFSKTRDSGSEERHGASQAAGEIESPDPEQLVEFKFPTGVTTVPSKCGFADLKLPANTKLYAAGAYAGRALDYQIDQSGHQATQIDIAVNQPGAPVALMLGAYEPTVWNIGWAQGSRIAAVLVSGYHRQTVAGLPRSVPLLVSTYDNKGPCGYFYVAADQIGRLNPIAVTAFGKQVDMVYPARNGAVLIGESLVPTSKLMTSPATPPDSFRDKTAPIAGEAGLRDAVRQGLLREARVEDSEAWALARASAVSTRAVPPIAGQAPPSPPSGALYNGYVVLKAMQIPAGLYGAHSATFFVPKSVPRPTGNLGHSKIYDFNTLTCAGLTCREE